MTRPSHPDRPRRRWPPSSLLAARRRGPRRAAGREPARRARRASPRSRSTAASPSPGAPSAGATSYEVYRGTSARQRSPTLSRPPASRPRRSPTRPRPTARRTTTRSARPNADGAVGRRPADRAGRRRGLARARPATRSASRTASRARPRGSRRTPTRAYHDGIEGFLSASSVDAGGSVDLRVTTGDWDVPVPRRDLPHGPLRRHPGPARSRTIRGLDRRASASATTWHATTGLTDCSDWTGAATISTTADWAVGRLPAQARPRGQRRRTARCCSSCATTAATPTSLFGVPTSTYQAYNASGGKSLYSVHQRRAEHGHRRRTARSRSRSTGPYSQPTSARDRARLVHAHRRRRPSPGSSTRATTRRYIASEDLAHQRRAAAATTTCSSPAPRRVLVAGDVRRGDRRAQRRHLAGLPRRQRRLLARPLRRQPDLRHAEPRHGRLQDDRERPGRPERHSDDAPAATPPARTGPRTS